MRVSCITPTYNRRAFWPRSVRCFLAQDYPDLEWVIIDNGTDPIRDLLPEDPRIRYTRLPEPKLCHGDIMNVAFSHADGEIGIVWDDDDWYAPDRVTRQVIPLSNPDIDVVGTSRLYYYVHGTRKAYRYQNWSNCIWIAAPAIRKEVWFQRPFTSRPYGADFEFLQRIPRERIFDLNTLDLLVSTVHADNASPKKLSSVSFIETPWEEVERIAGEALVQD